MILEDTIDQRNSMYPAFNYMLKNGDVIKLPPESKWGSIYGFSFGDNKIRIGSKTHKLVGGQYFSLFVGEFDAKIVCESMIFVIVRIGYKAQNVIGWVEEQGRLSYIDGCTDSLLIYPPRMGDPSLNLLHFPAGIEQTRHLHPSIRIGCVISGSGWSDVWENGQVKSNRLHVGVNFCLSENELHRFRTEGDHMTVIAWHPDGDWGPTDHNHTMLNRTYIK